MPESSGTDNHLVFTDPATGLEIRPITAEHDGDACSILADATGAGTPDAAQRKIDAARAGGADRTLGAFRSSELVAAYTLQRDGMANEIGIIGVAAPHRRQGIGRALLHDALRRSGRRPLVAETDEEGLGFYKACGFKMVGRRKQPDGSFRYRIGWHAPSAKPKGVNPA
jgi:GNAT superfamily N-acetyltransferase